MGRPSYKKLEITAYGKIEDLNALSIYLTEKNENIKIKNVDKTISRNPFTHESYFYSTLRVNDTLDVLDKIISKFPRLQFEGYLKDKYDTARFWECKPGCAIKVIH